MNLKEQIIKANKAYRIGTPIMSDAEYDILLSKLEDEMDVIEYLSFKESLMEESGSYKHKYIVGSLNKVRYGENELDKWINKHNVKEIVVSEKLDGCSFVAEYIMGMFVKGASRGDGKTGTDWTEKLKHILPQRISTINSVTIRGELVLCGDSHTILGYKNQRNGVVGIMNEDKIVPSKLKHVTALVYDMPSTNLNAEQIFNVLDKDFTTPKWVKLSVDTSIEEGLKNQLEYFKSISSYIMDGLVISTSDYVNENVYHPEKKIAFKVNSEGVKGQVTGIEWNVSKGGLLKPVVEINPIDIDGTTVKRVTGFNAKYIVDNGIGTGVNVMVIRSGEVIPKIINVLNGYPSTMKRHDIPTVCPSCNSKLDWKGVDLTCTNKQCGTTKVKSLASFLIKCGVEGVTDTSLENWGIKGYRTLLAFKGTDGKAQANFMKELETKVFSKPKEELFACMTFDGAGETNITKIINFYGGISKTTRTLYMGTSPSEFPEGIGYKTIVKIEEDWKSNLLNLKNIIMDSRYNPVTVTTVNGTKLSGLSFCITGTLSKPRKHFENLVINNGGTLGSVSKKLSYLIIGTDSGSKEDKAKSLGVTILTEEKFMEMIK